MNDSTLDYYRPTGPKPPDRHSAGFGYGSLLCLGVPIFGAIIRNGPLFILGGLISPIMGVVLGLVGFFGSLRTSAGPNALCAVSVGANALLGSYFFWLFFVHGLC